MNATLTRLERDVAMLRAQLASPPAVLSPLDVFRQAVGEADPWQADLLRSDTRQIIMLCSRQSGKSTVTSVLAAHHALYSAGSLTLIVSPSQRQSGELYAKVRGVLAALGLSRDIPATQETATTLRLANSSRVVSLPGTERTIRGYSAPDLVIEDEAARVEDATYQAVRPMLAVSGGRLVLLSTPFGTRGHFWQEWSAGGPDWHRVLVTAHDVPRIDSAWLEQERAAIGDWWYSQEFLCVFRDAIDSAFRSEDIDAMASADVRPLFAVA